MVGLLTARYNEGMILGQGFDSFLQEPRANHAISCSDIATAPANQDRPEDVSQVVTYTSRFVDKLSDVARSMDISAAACIRNGSIEGFDNFLGVDEAKFAMSDFNVLVSVKVVNQTTLMSGDVWFEPCKLEKWEGGPFRKTYGDCFVSGFIKGGEFHGIVSIKVLEPSKKQTVESSLKSILNDTSDDTLAKFDELLSFCETAISVNWSGGGQIKPAEVKWTMQEVFKVAAKFPAYVARTPRPTWAALSKYDCILSFVSWATPLGIKVKQYDNALRFTEKLLDIYMEYKNNLAIIRDVLANPHAYRVSDADGAFPISAEVLVKERTEMEIQLNRIYEAIDLLDRDPSKLKELMEKERDEATPAPEVLATKLPVLSSTSTVKSSEPVSMLVEKIAEGTADTGASDKIIPSSLASPKIEATLCRYERDYVTKEENRSRFYNYRFDQAMGRPTGGTSFVDCENMRNVSSIDSWPTRIEMSMGRWYGYSFLNLVKVSYDKVQYTITHGKGKDTTQCLIINLESDERVNCISMARGSEASGVLGIMFIQISTSHGQRLSIGSKDYSTVARELRPYDGAKGLRGFFGRCETIIDRLGPIWG